MIRKEPYPSLAAIMVHASRDRALDHYATAFRALMFLCGTSSTTAGGVVSVGRLARVIGDDLQATHGALAILESHGYLSATPLGDGDGYDLVLAFVPEGGAPGPERDGA